ncbi:LAFE_0D03730g1_1 [Lachancea fermentati]|uniref:LAFE_0D03730g1_1 n=1 Tax=Lachancea fermentati TaxID=4955 RepID=A0A1G4MB08_LACFM|nr:LAFE_0D03730g1_1 [Lachancea fermentati]
MVILEVLLIFLRIQKEESIILLTNILTLSVPFIHFHSLSYYVINPCASASTNFDDCFSFFMSS